MLFRSRLVCEGYSVVTAESGLEGLKILSREKIDLVISDLRMDEMDGLQLFAEIQKQQPGMPVIILTAHGSIPDAVAATQQGVFSFLTKPVDKDALYKAIDSALEHAAPAGDDASAGTGEEGGAVGRQRAYQRPERNRERDPRAGDS